MGSSSLVQAAAQVPGQLDGDLVGHRKAMEEIVSVPDPHRDLLRRELADMEVATQDEPLLGQGELSGEAERQRRAPARMQRLRGGCPARGEQKGVLVHGDDVGVLKLLDPRRLGGRVSGAVRRRTR
ncbi:MAG TPA: hypothetical protein VG388_13910 [Solirubrobacteraceae bacterium]|nr:hypothetical protein [Solirubrobacteraceae bacterium]